MNTKMKDGAIPVDPRVQEEAGITEDTPLKVRPAGKGRLMIESVDSIERIEAESEGRGMSGDEFLGYLERVAALPDKEQ